MQREMVHEHDGGNLHHHHHHQHLMPRFGNGNGAATGVARASKKSKPKKIPQRGLGVAQLEKLRMEEQKKMEGAAAAAAMSVSGAAHLGGGGGGLGHHLLPTHPLPPPLALGALPRPGGADGSGGYPPVLWDPSAAAVDPMKHPYKRSGSLCPQPPLPTVSTGLSLTAPSSHPTEPPSNQMYSSSSSSCCVNRSSAAAPADDDSREAAGVDRPWPFMFEGLMNTAAFRTTTGKAPFAARTTREAAGGLPDACPDLSRYEFRATNYFSSNASYNADWSSEFGHCKSSKENEPAAYFTLNAPRMKQPPALPSIHHLPEFGDFGVMQSLQHGSASASSSSSSRPFYSFMPVGPVRCERPLSEIKADASDAVDLELKL